MLTFFTTLFSAIASFPKIMEYAERLLAAANEALFAHKKKKASDDMNKAIEEAKKTKNTCELEKAFDPSKKC